MPDFVMAPVGSYEVWFSYIAVDPVAERIVQKWPVIAFDAPQAPLLMGAQGLVSPASLHPDYEWTLVGGEPATVTAPIIL